MKKGGLLALAVLMLLPACAFADVQGDFWTCNEDLYYHFNRNCSGAEDMVPISEAAARAFDKYACPVCFPYEDAGENVQAVVRGGTIVVHFSDAWLAKPELTGVFGWSPDSEYTGEEADQLLAEYLHGNAYNSFLADYLADGSAEGRARNPVILETNGELVMNHRHIGSDWYTIVRPTERFDNSWDMYWRINGIKLRMDGDSLFTNFDQQTVEEHKMLKLTRGGSDGPVFETENDAMQMVVYRELDANIAVIYEKSADKDFLEAAQLRIPGTAQGIEMDGYMDAGRGVYCCTLTDAELALLQNGAQAQVWHKPMLDDAQFMDSPYAEVRRGTGGSGIIDREGNFVVEAQYESVSRPEPDSFRITTPRPFFCEDKDGGLTVLHGETLDTIFQMEKTGDYIRGEFENPSVFTVHVGGRGKQLRSLTDGRLLLEMLYDETGNYSGEITNVDGYYRVLADGYPTRLVAVRGEGLQSTDWLIDNNGNRISDDYQRITPMLWSRDSGAFLVESFVTENYDAGVFAGEKQNAYAYGMKYDGSAYGEGWRCGLIDQDGNTLVEMKYTAVEAYEDGTIWFTAGDGNSLIWQGF